MSLGGGEETEEKTTKTKRDIKKEENIEDTENTKDIKDIKDTENTGRKRSAEDEKITEIRSNVEKDSEKNPEKASKEKREMEEDGGQEEPREDIYDFLSEEDREALEIGRKVRTKRKKKKRYRRRAVAAAAIAVAVLCAVGMQGGASRNWMLEALNRIMTMAGNRLQINFQNEQENVKLNEEKERKVWEEIREELNIPAIKFSYRPKGIKFDKANISKKSNEIFLYYRYKETIMNVYVQYGKKNSSASFISEKDAVLQDILTNNQEIEIKIWDTTAEKIESYAASFEYQDVLYFINGRLPLEEMKKMLSLMYLY